MNIRSTVDCMRKGYRQIGKPTFELRQALDRLLRSHAPQTTVVRIFALWRRFKGVLWRCETSEDSCRKTYRQGTFGNLPNQFTNPEWNVYSAKRCGPFPSNYTPEKAQQVYQVCRSRWRLQVSVSHPEPVLNLFNLFYKNVSRTYRGPRGSAVIVNVLSLLYILRELHHRWNVK